MWRSLRKIKHLFMRLYSVSKRCCVAGVGRVGVGRVGEYERKERMKRVTLLKDVNQRF